MSRLLDQDCLGRHRLQRQKWWENKATGELIDDTGKVRDTYSSTAGTVTQICG